MIQTDKYKKEIIGLLKKALEINSQLGEYEKHYLTEKARFVVVLTNGRLEIDIEVIKNFAANSEISVSYKLNAIVQSFDVANNRRVRSRKVNRKWKELFGKEG